MTGDYAGDRSHGRHTSNDSWAIPPASLQLKGVSVWALLVAVGMIAVILGGCGSAGSSAGKANPTASAAPTSLRLKPTGDGLLCASQIAWSPDSTRLAVLGDCGGAGPG